MRSLRYYHLLRISLALFILTGSVTSASLMSLPDIRLSLQSQYADFNLDSLGISNAAWTMNGYALLAGKGDTLEHFLAYKEHQIRSSLERYLRNHPSLSRNTKDLIILDMERPVNPQRIGDFDRDPTLQKKIILAFKLRIKIARDVFPKAKLSLFDVVGAPKTGDTHYSGFKKMMNGFNKATALGMFDDLDFLSPSLYVRFGPRDKAYLTTEKYTRTKIEYTQNIKTSDGKAIPLAPFLGFKIQNKTSAHHGECVRIDQVSRQLRTLLQYPSIKIIVFWSAHADSHISEKNCDIHDFFHKLRPIFDSYVR